MVTAREKYLAKCADDNHRRRYRAEDIARQEHRVIEAAKAWRQRRARWFDFDADQAFVDAVDELQAAEGEAK